MILGDFGAKSWFRPSQTIGVQRIKNPSVRGEGGPPLIANRVWEIRGFFAHMSELGGFLVSGGGTPLPRSKDWVRGSAPKRGLL